MTDNEHNEEIDTAELTAGIDENIAAGSDSEPETEPARTLPSPKTARLAYCAFADMRPAPGSKYAPMGLFGYIAVLVLTAVPLVGFIIAAIISLASKKLARRRLALAILLIQAFIFAAAGIFAIVCMCLGVDVLGTALSAVGI